MISFALFFPQFLRGVCVSCSESWQYADVLIPDTSFGFLVSLHSLRGSKNLRTQPLVPSSDCAILLLAGLTSQGNHLQRTVTLDKCFPPRVIRPLRKLPCEHQWAIPWTSPLGGLLCLQNPQPVLPINKARNDTGFAFSPLPFSCNNSTEHKQQVPLFLERSSTWWAPKQVFRNMFNNSPATSFPTFIPMCETFGYMYVAANFGCPLTARRSSENGTRIFAVFAFQFGNSYFFVLLSVKGENNFGCFVYWTINFSHIHSHVWNVWVHVCCGEFRVPLNSPKKQWEWDTYFCCFCLPVWEFLFFCFAFRGTIK